MIQVVDGIRRDLSLIADLVEPGARVLDVGCGDGALLAYLRDVKQVDARGVELSMAGVRECVARGLSVVQGDADTDLKDYPDAAFDVVILSQTLQATRNPRTVLEHLGRIGKAAIVSFPNFAHWRALMHLVLKGRMPVTPTIPLEWYETPNIHFCTIRDFLALADVVSLRVSEAAILNAKGEKLGLDPRGWSANMLGAQGVFKLTRRG
jgi:methionine biosynthesis protein MetW